MRIINALFVCCLVFSVSTSCKKAVSIEGSEPEKTVEQFFETYKELGPKSALNQLLLTNKYISKQNADSVGIKLESLTKDFGAYQGYEKLATKNYGEGIMRFTCIVKYSRLPIRFNFRFYQPGNGWRIQDFNYQTSFMNETD